MIRMRGTRQQIIQQWIKIYEELRSEYDGNGELKEEDFTRLFDVLYDYSGNLDDDELFMVLNERYDAKHRLVTSSAEYYISITSATWILCSAVAGALGGIGLSIVIEIMGRQLGGKVDAPLVKRLESALGESCIILEAARSKKDGIGNDLFKRNKGECVHADLDCRYREDGRCKCTPADVNDICVELLESGLLRKKGKKFYYNDIF